MRKIRLLQTIICITCISSLYGCGQQGATIEYIDGPEATLSEDFFDMSDAAYEEMIESGILDEVEPESESEENIEIVETAEPFVFINEEGMTLQDRINVPQGYKRIEADPNSFASFMRNYPLLPFGETVKYYNGNEKEHQLFVCSVFDLDMISGDLQQCVDSCMRLYIEYLISQNAFDKISFHYSNGTVHKYSKGQNVNDYMRQLFTYAGTLSMSKYDTVQIDVHDASIGDMFLAGGSPGHAMMIVDVAQDENGNKAFLVAQGYMPAQSFHLVRNVYHYDDPWFYEDELEFPCYVCVARFDKKSMMRHPVCLD